MIDIGLHFLVQDLTPDFRMGIMELNFHMDEKTPSPNERLKNSQRGTERKYLRLKRKVPGRPSGPAEFKFINLSSSGSILKIMKK